MSATPTVGTEISLTPAQIHEWHDGEKILNMVGQWPDGLPLSFSMPPLERAVPICRKMARRWLDAQRIHDEDTRQIVLLAMSELITNAIRHSVSTRITSRLWKAGDLLFVEIGDQGGTLSVPRPNRPDESMDHGRGLELVVHMSLGWGSRLGTDGSRAVWATVPLTRERGAE
jgi:anti-sigma regulatory factor (Ser/Thr protein kinase)